MRLLDDSSRRLLVGCGEVLFNQCLMNMTSPLVAPYSTRLEFGGGSATKVLRKVYRHTIIRPVVAVYALWSKKALQCQDSDPKNDVWQQSVGRLLYIQRLTSLGNSIDLAVS